MKTLYKKGNLEVFEYRPTIFRPLYVNMEPMKPVRYCRFFIIHDFRWRIPGAVFVRKWKTGGL